VGHAEEGQQGLIRKKIRKPRGGRKEDAQNPGIFRPGRKQGERGGAGDLKKGRNEETKAK